MTPSVVSPLISQKIRGFRPVSAILKVRNYATKDPLKANDEDFWLGSSVFSCLDPKNRKYLFFAGFGVLTPTEIQKFECWARWHRALCRRAPFDTLRNRGVDANRPLRKRAV